LATKRKNSAESAKADAPIFGLLRYGYPMMEGDHERSRICS
jgi:hypothetical protein